MSSDWEKIAFIQHDLLPLLKMHRGSPDKQIALWYDIASWVIDDYKLYLINKQSDDQTREDS